MRRLAGTLLFLAGVPVPHAFADDEADLEVIVTSDPFARWHGTRWRVDYQLLLPYPIALYAEDDHELVTVGYDLRMVIGCDLGDPLSRTTREVLCVVEDAAVSAAPWSWRAKHGQEVLDDTDRMLTGLTFALQVSADGRVTGLTLIDEPQGIRRVNTLYENLRQMIRRAMVGFHLRASGTYTVGEEWIERNSELLTLPSFRRLTVDVPLPGRTVDADGASSFRDPALPDGDALSDPANLGRTALEAVDAPFGARTTTPSFATLQAPASYGRSTVVHRMDTYRGRYLVQSSGEGVADLGAEVPLTFKASLDAVSVFDPSDAVMTERVWTVLMAPTAGSALADGVAGWPYRHVGSLRLLADDEVSDVGPSLLVAPPQTQRGNLPPWPAP